MRQTILLPNLKAQLQAMFLLSSSLDLGAHHEAVEDLPECAAAQLHPAEHPAVSIRPGKLLAAEAGLGSFDSRLGGEKCRRSGARLRELQSNWLNFKALLMANFGLV